MSVGTIFVWSCLVFLGLIIIIATYGNRRLAKQQKVRLASMSPTEREAFLENEKKLIEGKQKEDEERACAGREQWDHGALNPAMVCPHCAIKGKVRTMRVTEKRGVSGGKATAALLTGGFSMLLIGLSRKEKGTRAYCGNCKNQWIF